MTNTAYTAGLDQTNSALLYFLTYESSLLYILDDSPTFYNSQIWQNTKRQNTKVTIYKCDKIQIWQNINAIKYKFDKM